MKPIRTIAAAAALTCSLAAAQSAGAATVLHNAGGNVVVDAIPGETNRIDVRPGVGETVVLEDTGGTALEAWDDGCAQVDESTVECETDATVTLLLDNGNDRATVDDGLTGFGVFMYGEAGDDELTAGPLVSGIDGGPGRDTITGGAGHDAIDARDGEADTVSCGAGADEVTADPADTIAADCEDVDRPADPGPIPTPTPQPAPPLPQPAPPIPQPVPTATELVVKAGRAKLSSGVRLRVTAPGAGTISAAATAKGKRVASGSRTVSRAGQTSVTLKFTKRAKRSLRRARRVQLRVSVRFSAPDGSSTSREVKVTLSH